MPPQLTSPNVSGDWRHFHSSDEDVTDPSAVGMGLEMCAIGVPFIGKALLPRFLWNIFRKT